MKSEGDKRPRGWDFLEESRDPHGVSAFAECPHCGRLLETRVERCPHCYEEISDEYVPWSALVVVANTQACAVANTLKGFDAFVPVALALSAFIYAIDAYVYGSPWLAFFIPAWPLIVLASLLRWFAKYGRLKLVGDEEYARARRDMRSSLMLWLAILGLQVAVLAAWAL